jgi:hypothetical protein
MRRQPAREFILVDMYEVDFDGRKPLKGRFIKADSEEDAKSRMEAAGHNVVSVKKVKRLMEWGKSVIPSGRP